MFGISEQLNHGDDMDGSRREYWNKYRDKLYGCSNREFKEGQLYKIRHGQYDRTMRVESVSDGFVRFVDVNDSRIKCSGEIYTVNMPSCQSCNIDGCDIVFSYEIIGEK